MPFHWRHSVPTQNRHQNKRLGLSAKKTGALALGTFSGRLFACLFSVGQVVRQSRYEIFEKLGALGNQILGLLLIFSVVERYVHRVEMRFDYVR